MADATVGPHESAPRSRKLGRGKLRPSKESRKGVQVKVGRVKEKDPLPQQLDDEAGKSKDAAAATEAEEATENDDAASTALLSEKELRRRRREERKQRLAAAMESARTGDGDADAGEGAGNRLRAMLQGGEPRPRFEERGRRAR